MIEIVGKFYVVKNLSFAIIFKKFNKFGKFLEELLQKKLLMKIKKKKWK